MPVLFLDANACVGKRGLKHRLSPWRTEDLLAIMRQCGVAGALVCDGWSRDYSPVYGNARLTEELSRSVRLFGAYTLLPPLPGDTHVCDVSALQKSGMRAAKIYPASHKYDPHTPVMDAQYRALAEAGIPLLIDACELSSLEDITGILTRHPALSVILLGAPWPQQRRVFSLMHAFQNLYIDLSVMQANHAVESFVHAFGAHRLVFGSGAPSMSMGAARAMLDYADISDTERALIASGNIIRLCGLPQPAAQHVENDAYAAAASEGRPIPTAGFDSHMHILEDGADFAGGFTMQKGDLAHMAALNARMGVTEYCVAPWLGIWTDSEAGNEVALTMQQRLPDNVRPYVLIDPNYVDDVAAQVRKFHIEHHFPGMKMFYARTGVRYNAPVYTPWWEIANEQALFALMDSGGYPGYLEDIQELARRYPRISFFLDHAGRSFEAAEEYAHAAHAYENIYLQLTYTSVVQGMLEYLCTQGLAHKTLYGTDAPMRDARPQLGWITYAAISQEDKARILGGNMRRIHARCFKTP